MMFCGLLGNDGLAYCEGTTTLPLAYLVYWSIL